MFQVTVFAFVLFLMPTNCHVNHPREYRTYNPPTAQGLYGVGPNKVGSKADLTSAPTPPKVARTGASRRLARGERCPSHHMQSIGKPGTEYPCAIITL